MRRGANSVTSAVPIGSTLPMPMPAEIPKMIRSRPKNRKQRAPPGSKEFPSLVSLCYLLLEKLSKFLIPLSDCPFVLNRLPVFLGKSPCFREKTGKVIYRRHPQYDSHAAAAAFSRVQRNAVPRLSRIGQ